MPRARRRRTILGVATLVWAAVVGLTGTANTLAAPVTTLWKRRELAAAPGRQVQFVAVPGTPYSSARHYAVYLQGATPLTARLLTPGLVDARSGRLDALRPMPFYMAALLLAQPLHFGDYAGWPMKLLWAALDLLVIAMLWTGLRLWLGRRG